MSSLKIDHDGVPVTKVVFWGTTLAGKTTILKTMGLVKALEAPQNVFEFRRIEDEETMRTTGFDLLVLGVGTNRANPKLPLLKIHLFISTSFTLKLVNGLKAAFVTLTILKT